MKAEYVIGFEQIQRLAGAGAQIDLVAQRDDQVWTMLFHIAEYSFERDNIAVNVSDESDPHICLRCGKLNCSG